MRNRAGLETPSAVIVRPRRAMLRTCCRARPERQVRNPATNETLTKPADKQVKFTIAKALKDSVNA